MGKEGPNIVNEYSKRFHANKPLFKINKNLGLGERQSPKENPRARGME